MPACHLPNIAQNVTPTAKISKNSGFGQQLCHPVILSWVLLVYEMVSNSVMRCAICRNDVILCIYDSFALFTVCSNVEYMEIVNTWWNSSK